ncbi:MAG: hypothetical protein R3C45_17135 [Phycisphaerales bacterium]
MTMIWNKIQKRAIGFGFAGAVLALTPALGAAVTYDTRVLTGDAAPHPFSDPSFTGFRSFPVINSQGRVAFIADIAGPGIGTAQDSGIWYEDGGTVTRVMLEGFRTVRMPSNVFFSSFAELVINDAGQVAFLGKLTGSGVGSSNDDGVWSNGSGSLDMLAREGDPAPQTEPGVNHNALFYTTPKFNNAGQTAFFGNIIAPGLGQNVIWLHNGGELDLVARDSAAAPGLPGVQFGPLNQPTVNGSGVLVFQSSLSGAGVTATNDTAIWAGGPGSLSVVARAGDPAPGLDPAFSLSGFEAAPVINDAGQIAFVGYLDGPGMTLLNNYGIWTTGTGAFSLVARSGAPAPDIEAGVNFQVLSQPMINSAGRVAFHASLIGSGTHSYNNDGIWSDASGSLRLVARDGQAAPGTDPGVIFYQVGESPYPLFFNNAGQIAFRSKLVGPGVTAGVNDLGIWMTDHGGGLELIARTGDLFDVNDDPLIEDLRTISAIDEFNSGGSGGQDGRGTSLNDAGQLVFRLAFTDGTQGIFVAALPLVGDLNGDGFVGIQDLNIVLGAWNQNVDAGVLSAGDFNGDGFVGIEDLNAVLGHWNAGTPPADFAVPEPARFR